MFVGVTDPIDTTIETPEEVRDRALLAARYIPVDQLGTCDDAGFAPYADDTSTSRDLAFAKVDARVRGTALAPPRTSACNQPRSRGFTWRVPPGETLSHTDRD